jgi:hypothetical protein
MILFFEYGRLGNQLFQYCGFKKYFPNHNLIFFGCEDLKNSCNNLSVKFIDINKKLKKLPFHILRELFIFLANIRILGKITHSNEKFFTINVRRGLLFNIYVAHSVYFQHRDCIKDIVNPPILKKNLLRLAREWLKKKNIFFYQKRLIFVHIRRGDYLFWPSIKFPAALSLTWYKRAMLKIRNKVNKPIFILMGDDLFFIRKNFKESNFLIISNNKAEVDLAIMSMCSHGVLSPSSFSWWGAFFARAQKKTSSYFIATKFWTGHRINKWHPSNFYTNWLNYIK